MPPGQVSTHLVKELLPDVRTVSIADQGLRYATVVAAAGKPFPTPDITHAATLRSRFRCYGRDENDVMVRLTVCYVILCFRGVKSAFLERFQ